MLLLGPVTTTSKSSFQIQRLLLRIHQRAVTHVIEHIFMLQRTIRQFADQPSNFARSISPV
jgi:hypothetical protein